ncbi:MAG: glycosyltransferase [Myxococcaceae bacterium]
MSKLVLIIFVLLTISACKESDYCVGCSDLYPYFTDSHLKISTQTVDKLPPTPASSQEDLASLNKVIVFPVSSKRYTVVSFPDEFLSALEKKGWRVLDSDRQIHNADPLVDIKNFTGFENTDIVAFYMTEMSEVSKGSSRNLHQIWTELSDANFLKVSILEDFMFPFQISNASYFCQYADVILVRYPEALHQIVPDCQRPAFYFPHSAGKNYFKAKSDFKDKEPAVLLSGAINERWYPLRVKALQLFEAGQKNMTYRKHSGSKQMDPVAEAKSYAAQISKHEIALTGAVLGVAVSAPYIVAKHFEIPATGTVVVTDKFVTPLMARLGFVENEHYLTSTPVTLKADLARWLAPGNKSNLEKIGMAGQKLVAERHALEKRIEEFEKVVYYAWTQKKK